MTSKKISIWANLIFTCIIIINGTLHSGSVTFMHIFWMSPTRNQTIPREQYNRCNGVGVIKFVFEQFGTQTPEQTADHTIRKTRQSTTTTVVVGQREKGGVYVVRVEREWGIDLRRKTGKLHYRNGEMARSGKLFRSVPFDATCVKYLPSRLAKAQKSRKYGLLSS